MYNIRLEGDTTRLLKKMKGLSEIDKEGINKASGQAIRGSTLERFKKSEGPTGNRWRTSIRAASQGGKTLVNSATLRNSIRIKSDESGFAVGTNLKYAATHQFGVPQRTIRAKKAKALQFQINGKWIRKKSVSIRIPARPFLGISQEDEQEIKGIVEDALKD